MRVLPLLLIWGVLLGSCDDKVREEIYNENNTSVSGGVVYSIEDKPIDGLYKIYYSDGTVKMEVQSKNGVPNGVGKFYTAEGLLNFQGNFANGRLHGAFYNYYPDGLVHNEMNYEHGELHGVQRSYDDEGNLTIEIVYENGKPVSGFTMIKDEKSELTAEELAELK